MIIQLLMGTAFLIAPGQYVATRRWDLKDIYMMNKNTKIMSITNGTKTVAVEFEQGVPEGYVMNLLKSHLASGDFIKVRVK